MYRLSKIFKEKGLKLTPQRIAVYDYLMSTKEHPSAEIIYHDLIKEFPSMSLATVYKSLKVLCDARLVQELNLGEGNFRYDALVEEHPHVQCTICSRVEDILGVPMTLINQEIDKHTDYTIQRNKLYFYGVCRSCQAKEA